jgi:hypothetical protein
MQSVPITTKFVSSNPVHGDVYSIQHYVIKIVGDLRQVGGFLRVIKIVGDLRQVLGFLRVIKIVGDLWQVSGFLRVSCTNKTDITEILLKVALSTITLKP